LFGTLPSSLNKKVSGCDEVMPIQHYTRSFRGRERSERTRNPEADSAQAPGFRVRAFRRAAD
jgi:hypothetical protein